MKHNESHVTSVERSRRLWFADCGRHADFNSLYTSGKYPPAGGKKSN